MRPLCQRMALWRRIWVMAAVGEHPAVMLGGSVVLAIVVLIGALLGHNGDFNSLQGVCRLGGIVLAALAGVWWSAFCGGAARQNSPANACLVPGLNIALRECAVLVWILTMLALLPLVWTHPDGAMLYPQFALTLTGLGLYRAGREDGFAVLVAIILLYVFGSASQPLMMFLIHPAGIVCASLLAIVYAASALPRAFPVGGERHWAMGRKQQRARARNDMLEWNQARRRQGRRLRLHAWVLARDSHSGGRPADMLLHGLGPGNHRYQILTAMACGTVLFLSTCALMALLGIPKPDLMGMAGTLTAVSIVMLLAMHWARYGVSIRSTPGEQAVLRLAPALPAAPALNGVLARRILTIGLYEWAAVTVLVLGMVWLCDGSAAHLRVVLILAANTLASMGISLQDFAHKPETNTWENGILALWMMAVLMLGIALRDDLVQWCIVLALQLATSLTYVTVCWRRMQRAPVALPAGRMA